MHKLYTLTTFLLACFLTFGAQAQLEPGLENGHPFMHDAAAFELVTDPAPPEGTGNPVMVQLPSPLGELMDMWIVESNLLEDELDQAYPGVKSYIIGDELGGQTMGRMIVSPRGVDVVLRTENGLILIEPDVPGEAMHRSYFTNFLPPILEGDDQLIPDGVRIIETAPRNNLAFGNERLTYRLAVIADGEYSQQRGGPNPTEAAVVAAVAADVSAINVIYERDLAIRLVLSEVEVYLDPATDPFPNAGNGAAGEAVVAFGTLNNNGTLTTADYDIGHVFSGRSGGSSAYIQAACRNFNIDVTNDNVGDGPLKAGGGSKSNNVQGAGWLTLVAHEMGHQFGATHTFNGNSGNCSGGNYTPESAYEIGSGSTIMSYGGICGDDNLAGGRDLYFHINSIESIYEYTRNGNGASCPTVTNVSNSPPSADANPTNASYTIPRGTPFVLTGAGSDPNGDLLTYVWEQYNLGNQGDPAAAAFDTGGPGKDGAPLFRSLEPSPLPLRYFPLLPEILGQTDFLGEVLPQVGRELDFRLTVRDNNSGAGGIACDQITLQVDGGSGPFSIIDPEASTVWMENSLQIVQWSVANTNTPPVNCQNVRITMSTDNGQSFPFVLAASTPNDGQHTITVPNITVSAAYIRVEALNNIFFDISNTPISISSSCTAEAGSLLGNLSVMAEAGDPELQLGVMPNYGTAVTGFSASIGAGDPTVNLHVESTSGCQSFSNNPRYESRTFRVSQTGTYTFSLSGSQGFPYIVNVHQGGFSVGSPCATLLESNGVYNGSLVNRSNFVTTVLQAGQDYELVMSGFNSTDAGTVNVDIDGPPGSTVFSGVVPPGSSFSYRYAIVDVSTNGIVAIQTSPDLSSAQLYPAGTYRVYGVSVLTSDVNTLNTYAGSTINTLINNISLGTLCADVSGNFAEVVINAASLPIELISFTGRNDGPSVRLDWATEAELDNDYFLLERSADGRIFTAFAEIRGQGNSQIRTDYAHWDEEPLAGRSFYRLTQFDFDGSSTVAGIISVERGDLAEAVHIFPNPVTTDAVNITWGETVVTQLTLLDATGRRVATYPIGSDQRTHQWQLPVLPAGMYWIQLQYASGEQTTVRLVKK